MMFQSPSPPPPARQTGAAFPPARSTGSGAAFPPARSTGSGAAFPPARQTAPSPEPVAVAVEITEVINDALLPQGLRYDPGIDAIVRNGGHSMTLRSQRNRRNSLRMCYLRDMLTALREDVTEICFVKANGSVRRMYCSLTGHATTGNICVNPVPLSGINHPDRALYHPDDPYRAWCKNACGACTAGHPLIDKNRLTVWDVQRNAWRSFNIASILTVNRTLFKL